VLRCSSGIPGDRRRGIKMIAGKFGSVIIGSIWFLSTSLWMARGVSRTVGREGLKLGSTGRQALAKDEWRNGRPCFPFERTKTLRPSGRIWSFVMETSDWSKHPMEWPSAGSVFKNKKPAILPGRPSRTAGLEGIFGKKGRCLHLYEAPQNFHRQSGRPRPLDGKSLDRERGEKKGVLTRRVGGTPKIWRKRG